MINLVTEDKLPLSTSAELRCTRHVAIQTEYTGCHIQYTMAAMHQKCALVGMFMMCHTTRIREMHMHLIYIHPICVGQVLHGKCGYCQNSKSYIQ